MKYTENMLTQRVNEAMRARKITQAQLAEVLGLSQQHVSARLLGHTRFTVADLAAMANLFNCTPGELLAADDVLFSEGL